MYHYPNYLSYIHIIPLPSRSYELNHYHNYLSRIKYPFETWFKRKKLFQISPLCIFSPSFELQRTTSSSFWNFECYPSCYELGSMALFPGIRSLNLQKFPFSFSLKTNACTFRERERSRKIESAFKGACTHVIEIYCYRNIKRQKRRMSRY